jgi:flavin reductase (DIM6/NTAB) family NADH-FMN oxidoreductase RutF
MAEEVRSGGVNSEFGSIDFRRALGRFASGVTVLTVDVGGSIHGMTAASFCSVSLNPPLIAVAVDRRAHMHAFMQQSTSFGVSVLTRDQEPLSDHFAGRVREVISLSFLNVEGIPLIEGALVHLCCSVEQRFETGDHTMYIGRVEYLSFKEDDEPLIFYASRYRSLANTNGG